MSEPEPRPEPAPEGSTCAVHEDRPALVTCPRCGNYCCLACWHQAQSRCHACLLRDPQPPVPWADPSKSLAARFVTTLAHAFSPTKSAPTFSHGVWTKGISFALLTALPLALLTGIIPFTHRLRFGPSFIVSTIGTPTDAELGLDIAQAIGLGLLFVITKLVLLGAPYLSLSKAYGQPNDAHPSRQVLLYRGWLLVLGGQTGAILSLVVWGLPAEPDNTWLLFAEVASLLPLMLLLWSMTATARMSGVGPFAAMAVTLVPFVALFLIEPLLIDIVRPLLPDPELMREAAQRIVNSAPVAV
ncbi:MAG TPA: hypothetical protein ENK57_07145 [Polyangiaceae bacterium]|nr:hypothetical protein [Polyangiaceae bacterium]